MNRFWGAGLVVFALACQVARAENPAQNCFVAKPKAEARNEKAAADKALKRPVGGRNGSDAHG